MPQSWEYYQQNETGAGIPYPIYWLCGLASTTLYNQASALATLSLPNSTLFAIPFDQMRAVTVSKMFINLFRAAPVGGKVRLGIYRNASNSNNVPSARVLDAGEITIDSTATLGVNTIGSLSTNLVADTRYWAVMFTNGSVGGGTPAQINGLGTSSCPIIFWAAMTSKAAPYLQPVTGLLLSGQTYGALPATFPAVDSTTLATSIMPCIGLAFSGIT